MRETQCAVAQWGREASLNEREVLHLLLTDSEGYNEKFIVEYMGTTHRVPVVREEDVARHRSKRCDCVRSTAQGAYQVRKGNS